MKMLSQLWQVIQGTLFPQLEEEYGRLTERQEKLIRILEILELEKTILDDPGWRGRPQKSRVKIARAFVVKAVYDLSTTRLLIDLLKNSPFLRRVCGYERCIDIPHESSFSRAFEEFAQRGIPQRIHEYLIKEYEGSQLVGHLSYDSTAIEGNEKPVKASSETEVEKPAPKRKRGRPGKDDPAPVKEPSRLEQQVHRKMDENIKELPTACDCGCKKNSQGFKTTWIGYKLHVDFADGGIPIACILTSASVHDSQVAIPLMQMSQSRVDSLYDLMDAAYDAAIIRDFSAALGHKAIIDTNPRRGEKIAMDPATQERYKERTTAERGFSRLKEEFGACQIKVRGALKVMAHLMFGVICLTADQLHRRFA